MCQNLQEKKPRQQDDASSPELTDEIPISSITDEKEDDESRCTIPRITHGFYAVRGKMDHGMEDYFVAKKRQVDGYELGLYAIFDGHSGADVAKHLRRHLFENILNEPDFWTDPEFAVKRAYGSTDDEILENVAGSRGGSTAVTAIVINGETLIVANVGDSRAVLCRKGVAEQITVDHEPQKEEKLVESKGGFVTKAPGNVPRVDGQLAMTRAFGDGRLKDHITSEPDVMIEKIDADTQFMILASDGLWKVMSNQEAVDWIKDLEDAQEASKELIKEALSRKSYDDISCIVAIFH